MNRWVIITMIICIIGMTIYLIMEYIKQKENTKIPFEYEQKGRSWY